MWSHSRCSYQLFKQKRAFFVGSSCIKIDFPLQHNMSAYRQLNVYCLLGRNTVCGPPTYKHNSLSILCKNNFSTCCVHFTRLEAVENIDLEAIKKQVTEERKKNPGSNLHLTAKLKEIVAARCDEIVANLGPEDEKKLKVVQLEHSFLYSEGYLIPVSMLMFTVNKHFKSI